MTRHKTYGLLGFPVKHSFSPAMHNAAFRALKIKSRYILFEKSSAQLPKFFSSLRNNNICGFNVTSPYKERVLGFIDGRISEGARAIGAANTIVVGKNGKLSAYNTDYMGFTKHIRQLKLKPKRIAIIGAGGAAKAICFALGKQKCVCVAIYDIDKFKALALAKKFNAIFENTRFSSVANIEDLKTKDRDLLINASPVGMHKDDPCLIGRSLLHKGLFVYDLIYNPPQTKLIKLSAEEGISCANGLGMLLYQGVEALSYWIKPRKAPVEVMRKALTEAIKNGR